MALCVSEDCGVVDRQSLAVSYATLTALPQRLSLLDAWWFHGKERVAGGNWLAATTAQWGLELDAGDDKSGHR